MLALLPDYEVHLSMGLSVGAMAAFVLRMVLTLLTLSGGLGWARSCGLPPRFPRWS